MMRTSAPGTQVEWRRPRAQAAIGECPGWLARGQVGGWSILLLLSAFLLTPGGAASAASEAEQAEICREADARFQELYGKPAAAETPPVVAMYKHTFCPPRLVVRQGTVVRFVNIDKRTSHSFWFKDAGHPESERFFPGEGTSMTMDLAPGEHVYLCGPHWEQEKMVGRITVTPR